MTHRNNHHQTDSDRRAFLANLGQCIGGACLTCALGPLASQAVAATSGPKLTREVDYYDKLSEQRISCGVCPHHCTLSPGEIGFCRARTNVNGKHFSKANENPCIIRDDPIEKLPLSHFMPGTRMLTIAAGGCNLRCLYCQNWEQSQKAPDEQKNFHLTVQKAIASAKKKGLRTIAFTYTDPIAFLEYAKDISKAAKKAGLRVAVGSALHVNPEPLLDLAKYVDAFSITLKGFDDQFYRDVCGVELDNILTAIATLREKTNCWIELINLIVPTYNDNMSNIKEMARWIKTELGNDIPLHFARFVPMYKLANLPRTSVQTLESACKAADKVGLKYVYTANIAPHERCNTTCPKCGTNLIERLGPKVLANSMIKNGSCPQCRTRLRGIWK